MSDQNLQPPLVSVIIPSYNSRDHIRDCLDSLSTQTTNYLFEIIIVDSSDDGTVELIKSIYPSVKIIELNHRTFPGQARNIGIKESKGKIIVFTDSDCVVVKDWIDVIIHSHNKKGFPRVIGGAVCNGTARNLIGTAEYFLEFSEFTPFRAKGEVRLLPTCNVSFRREIFEEYGYFDDVIKGSDTLFSREIIQRGEKIYFTPAFQVYHKNRTSLKKFLKNQYELGLGSAQIRRKKEMPGSILLKIPILIPFIGIVRLQSIGNRLLGQNIKLFFHFVIIIPVILGGLLSYICGFIWGRKLSLINLEG